MVKNPSASSEDIKRRRFDPWVGKIPWRRAWKPTPVFSPGEPHEWSSLVGCSPQGHKKSNASEATEHARTYGRIKEKDAA